MKMDQSAADDSEKHPNRDPRAHAEGAPRDPIIRPIDCETLLERYRQNPALVERLVFMFERRLSKQLDALRLEFNRHDVESAARTVHAMQAMAAEVSAEPIRASAAELERRLLACEFQNAEQSLLELEALVRQCRDYLPDVMARVS